MKIAFDVDGVLRDFTAGVDKFYKVAYPDHDLSDLTQWGLEERYPIGKKIYDFVFKENAWNVFKCAPQLFKDGNFVFRYLQKNHFVGIITSQNEVSLSATLAWLGENNYAPDFLFCTRFDIRGKKVSKSSFDFDVLIDDNLNNLEECRGSGKHAIAIAHPWNDGWTGDRVNDIADVVELIDKFDGGV